MKNLLVLTYWSFNDALIQAYTLPYLTIMKKVLPEGSTIHLVTLEREQPTQSVELNSKSSERLGTGIIHHSFRYRPAGIRAVGMWVRLLVKLARTIHRKDISTIHCWATPAGGLGYLLSIITGKELVIDSFEPHAEAMVENGTWRKNSMAFRLLFAFEKYQARRAKYIVAAHEGMRSYALEKYGVNIEHMLVKPACVDLELFDGSITKDGNLLQSLKLVDKIVCVYAGKFGGIYLDIEVFDFLKEAHTRWGDRFRVLLLTSHREEEINRYCSAAGLDRSILVVRFVPHQEIPSYIGLGDFALTPVKPVPTKRYCTPIKDGEYWAMGLPVVIPNGISNDSSIIRQHGIGAVLDRLDTAAYRSALDTLDTLLAQPREELRKRIRNVASAYRSFAIAEQVYQEVYGR